MSMPYIPNSYSSPNLIYKLFLIALIDVLIFCWFYDELYDEENSKQLQGYEKVQNTECGAVNVMTGVYTGRSPKDKYILKDNTDYIIEKRSFN